MRPVRRGSELAAAPFHTCPWAHRVAPPGSRWTERQRELARESRKSADRTRNRSAVVRVQRRMRFLLPRLLLLAATAIPVPSQSTLALFSRPKPSVAPRAAQRPSLRASSVEAALGSDEVEAELCRGLVAVELVGRVPRTRQGRSLGRHVQMRKDASQRVHAP
jgi:hypothetical protein